MTYDGYSTAPITVGRDRLVLAEFDRAGALTPSVPLIDLVKPRRLTWAYDRYLQPQLYWHSILKGRVSRTSRTSTTPAVMHTARPVS